MRERSSTRDAVTGYAFLAIVVVLVGLFWYFFSMGAMLTYDRAQCNRMNIGETCIILVQPAPLLPLL
tara:strand:- start:1447 stop:1647 length:201 start_codon:yes stop_codon:yes gene_type:complete